MIHKACMPVYMNSGKIVAGGRDGWTSKVLQEVLADLKRELDEHCEAEYRHVQDASLLFDKINHNQKMVMK